MKRKKSTEDRSGGASVNLLVRHCPYQCFVGFAFRNGGQTAWPDIVDQCGPVRIAGSQMRSGGGWVRFLCFRQNQSAFRNVRLMRWRPVMGWCPSASGETP